MVLLVISACSGTGKSTVARRLLEAYPGLRLSVSHTTRAPRPGEVDGRDYYFVDRSGFEARIAANELVEWAEYAGNLYGTACSTVEAAAAAGHDLLFDVEVIGAAALKVAYPEAVSCFLLPPSWVELEARLRGRGTESEASLARRLETGRRELGQAHHFDYLVVNDQLESAVADVATVYRAAGLRAQARRGLLESLR